MFPQPEFPVRVAAWALSSGGVLAGPMDPSAPTPRLLDSDQFAALCVGMGLVIALLATLVVLAFRGRG